MKRTFKKISTFIFLDSKDKQSFFLLLFYIYYYKVVVAFLGFRFYKKQFQQDTFTANSQTVNTEAILTIQHSFKRIKRFIFWKKSYCLVNALAVGKLCRRFQLPYQIHLGGRKSGNAYEAHAWLTVGDTVLVGQESIDKFIEIGKFKG